MSGEMVFTVSGTTATAAERIDLAAAGFKERQHLQEWVLAHPEVLGEDIKIVSSEFGRWAASSGALERDRLDVLALDRDGRLIVVELKRDTAPDTVDMQALKYAALVSRFTRDTLAKVHADYLTRRRGELVDPESAEAELEQWLRERAEITEESLRLRGSCSWQPNSQRRLRRRWSSCTSSSASTSGYSLSMRTGLRATSC